MGVIHDLASCSVLVDCVLQLAVDVARGMQAVDEAGVLHG